MKPMKAYTNILQLRMNMALRRAVVRNYPVAAFIEPTSFCNLRCPACPTGLRLSLRPAKKIEWDFYKSVIDEIGDYLLRLYMYNWGEPLLHQQTPEFIQYAKSKNIEVILSSNLSQKLTDNYIERLVKSGLDQLIVGLDGATEETYKKYRRGGNYSLVKQNLSRIQSVKSKLGLSTPTIICQFLVFKHNEHEIDTVKADYKNWGADGLTIGGAEMPFAPYNEGFEPSTISKYNIYSPENQRMLETKRQLENGRPCSWLYGTLVLNPNGHVSPCCSIPDQKDDFGEYAPEQGFFEVWNSERFRRARKIFSQSKKRSTDNSLSDRQIIEISRRIDGMAVNLNSSQEMEELICHKCPIPHLQNQAIEVINTTVNELIEKIIGEKDMQALIAYILMGMPNVYQIYKQVGLRKVMRRIVPLLFSQPQSSLVRK